ncbi:MAG: hypothetical protein O9346_15170 [Leptospiraceae bacterium]|nr:hypothetical protein [Leptospiraceae bacterium]MCZ8347756.1 hypothetical protein [Leptospiraceae bacterium]
MNKIYESYYYRELKNNRIPISEKDYLKQRAKGKKRKNGSYKAPSYAERLGYPRYLSPFIIEGKLDKKLLENEILKLADILDSKNLTNSSVNHYENRLARLLEYT